MPGSQPSLNSEEKPEKGKERRWAGLLSPIHSIGMTLSWDKALERSDVGKQILDIAPKICIRFFDLVLIGIWNGMKGWGVSDWFQDCVFNSFELSDAGHGAWNSVAGGKEKKEGGLRPTPALLSPCPLHPYTQPRSLQGSNACFATLSARRRTCLSATCRSTSSPGCLSATCATSSWRPPNSCWSIRNATLSPPVGWSKESKYRTFYCVVLLNTLPPSPPRPLPWRCLGSWRGGAWPGRGHQSGTPLLPLAG